MIVKSRIKDDLRELKSMAQDLKTVTNKTKGDDNEFIITEEQHCFEHSLIDFEEPVDEYNMRDILPAFPSRTCYIPIPPTSGSTVSSRGEKIKK